jgi:hypothetical protein
MAPEAEESVITTSILWLDVSLGLLAAGIVFGALLLLTWWDRHRQERAAAQLHVPQHRALDSAPVQVIRLPAARIEERTEEMPVLVEPVVHVEVSESSAPLADVFVPLGAVVDDGLPRALAEHVTDSASGDARHLGRIDGALRGYHARLSGANATIDRWLREAGELPGRAEARRAAYPHCDDPSVEIPRSEVAALVAAGRAGAR